MHPSTVHTSQFFSEVSPPTDKSKLPSSVVVVGEQSFADHIRELHCRVYMSSITHQKSSFSIIEIVVCEVHRCSGVRLASRFLVKRLLSSSMMCVESAISSPLSSTNGSIPFLLRSDILWSTFWTRNKTINKMKTQMRLGSAHSCKSKIGAMLGIRASDMCKSF